MPRLLAGLLGALALAAAGCGDGGGFAVASGGTSGTGISAGPVTGFGSAFVTDVEWELGGASVEIDDAPGSEAELRLGMVVRIRGSIAPGGATGTATSVVADDSIEGPIDGTPVQVGPNGNGLQFTVFGFPVHAERGVTVFDDGATFEGLASGDVIEVYGLTDDTGTIVATRIERRAPGATESELKGVVSNLSTGSDTFVIGSVTVTYDEATTLFRNGLADEGDLANGLGVEVKGSRTGPLQIDAAVIQLEDDVFGVDDADEARLRGFVSMLSGSQFTVSGIPVDAGGATFEPAGLTLANGDFVEVEGRLGSGTLIARKVELEDLDDRDGDAVEIQAELPAGGKDAFGPNTLRMIDPATGIQVQVNGATRYDDQRDDVPGFGFADIAEGDWLEIRAVAVDAAGGIVVATRIERDDTEDDVILQGPVTALDRNAQSLSILGQPIVRDPGAEYRDLGDDPIGAGAFFQSIDLDDVVKAKDASAVSAADLGPVDELGIESFDP